MKPQTSLQNLRLSDLAIGQKGILSAPTEPFAPEVLRLLEMGMVDGHEIRLLRCGPFGSPMHVTVCGTDLCLRKNEASLFLVQPIE